MILAINTSTPQFSLALVDESGTLLAEWTLSPRTKDFRHLMTALDHLLQVSGVALEEISGLAVAKGPGSFTGLRVGIATAKGLAAGLGVPLAGIGSAAALAAAAVAVGAAPAGGRVAILLPAGPSERTLEVDGAAVRLGAGEEPDLGEGTTLVAVDLDGRAPADALARGEAARGGFTAALARAGATRLRAGGDDLARLVPEYVTPPRGVAAPAGEVAWSRTPG